MSGLLSPIKLCGNGECFTSPAAEQLFSDSTLRMWVEPAWPSVFHERAGPDADRSSLRQ